MKHLTKTEIKGLERDLRLLYETRPSHALYIWILLYTGARRREGLNIQWQDVDGNRVLIRGLKGSNNRVITLPDKIMRLLRTEPKASEYVFNFSTSVANRIWASVRPRVIPLHYLRHAFGTHVYERTRDLVFTQTALGHVSSRSTDRYIRCLEYDEKMQSLNIYGS